MYEVQDVGGGRPLRRFIRYDVSKLNIDGWQEWTDLYVFPDLETYEITEENIDISLSEFLARRTHPYRYKVSPDEEKVIVADASTGEIAFAYIREDKPEQ